MLTPTTLAAYLLPAMFAWVPPLEHSKSLEDLRPQYERQAAAIAVVTLNTDDNDLPFAGPHRHEMTALLLGSIASFESHFREDVATCAKGGDNDRSWGPFQTQRPKASVCASLEGAATIALGMVTESFSICRKSDVRDRLAIYTDGRGGVVKGKCRDGWWRSRSRIDRARAWHAEHEIAVVDE